MRLGFPLALAAAAACAQTVQLPPISTTVDVKGQPFSVTVTAALEQHPAGISVFLDAGLADLQRNLLPILAAQLNQSNRCGERIELHDAALKPAAPSAILETSLHFEKRACAKAFGKEIVKKLAGGDGAVRVRLTPRIDNGSAFGLDSEVVAMDADGSLGDLLRSGQLGDALREKIRETIASALQKSLNPRAVLPPALQDIVSVRSAQFRDAGQGTLALHVAGEVRIPADQAAALMEKLKPHPRP
jgi:hypothetical protein